MEHKPTQLEEPKTLWNRSYILILLMSVFTGASSQMVTPFMSKYALSLGAPLSLAATIASLMSIIALFLRPISGLCSDRYNRKLIILGANVVTSLCLAAYSFTTDITSLMVVRVIHGIVFSFSGVASMAFNTSFMPRDRIGEGLGWMALSAIVSAAVGPNLGLWLVEGVGYSTCFLVAAFICIGSSMVLLTIRYQHVRRDEAFSRKININSLISIRILPYVCIMALFSCGNALTNTFLALIGDVRGIANISLFFTTYSVAMVAVRPFSGKLLDRKGLRVIIFPGLVIATAGMVMLGASTSLWMVVAAGLLKACGQGATAPSIQAHCIKQLGREKAGVVSSTCYIGQDLGHAVAPTIGSYVAAAFGSDENGAVTSAGYAGMFYSYAAILIVGGSLLYIFKSRYDLKKYGAEAAFPVSPNPVKAAKAAK